MARKCFSCASFLNGQGMAFSFEDLSVQLENFLIQNKCCTENTLSLKLSKNGHGTGGC